MTPPQLLRWQWDGYPRYHRTRTNLALHAVVVPLFLFANVTLLLALAGGLWLRALAGAAAMAVSVALQGSGHRKEPVPPEPFTSPANAIARLVLEQ